MFRTSRVHAAQNPFAHCGHTCSDLVCGWFWQRRHGMGTDPGRARSLDGAGEGGAGAALAARAVVGRGTAAGRAGIGGGVSSSGVAAIRTAGATATCTRPCPRGVAARDAAAGRGAAAGRAGPDAPATAAREAVATSSTAPHRHVALKSGVAALSGGTVRTWRQLGHAICIAHPPVALGL
jgi:hypothetical protein